jgi:penicillin-binding protein 2
MNEMVNGRGTGARARLPIEGVKMAGKSGTAQVVGLNVGNGKSGPWKHRDHGHFICFAPFDNPRYACAVTIEHGGGSGAAMPVARDIMTYLWDKQKAMDALLELEKQWGGTPTERLNARYRSYAAQYGVNVPAVTPQQETEAVGADGPAPEPVQPIVRDAQSPAPEPTPNAPDPASPSNGSPGTGNGVQGPQ